MFPLQTVLFPEALLPLHVFEPRYRALLADCLSAAEPEFGVVLIARGSEVGGGDTRHELGTVARVEASSTSADGRSLVLARGVKRLRVRSWLADDPYPMALVEELADEPGDVAGPGQAATMAVRRVEALLSELGDMPIGEPERPGRPVSLWQLCHRLPVNPLDRQRLLEADASDRPALLVELANALSDDMERLLAQGG